MLQQVWERARQAEKIERLIIATDDQRIADAADGFGAEVAMTSSLHASGTDRVAEVVRASKPDYTVILNIQGDEPLLTPTSLDRLIAPFEDDATLQMTTLAEPLEDPEQLFDPNVVKVVTRLDGRALYFSRSPIPFHRGRTPSLVPDFRPGLAQRPGGLLGYRKHQGLYGYTREALFELTRLGPSPLEEDEGLEQLRALQAGFSISVVDSDYRSQSVDTPADLDRASRLLLEASQ